MKVIDDGSKKLHWWNRNYFFAGTLVFIVINILLFWLAGDNWETIIGNGYKTNSWSTSMNFDNMIRSFLNAFSHGSWRHVLLNMLCFLVLGIYLERKKGTLPFAALVLTMIFLSSLAIGANYCSVRWHGFSGVNYALCAYVIVDFIFMLVSKERTKTNIIFGIIMIVAIYLAMCMNVGSSFALSFEWYPHDLINNMAHYSSMLVGAMFSVVLQLTKLFAKKEEFNTREKK